MIRSGSSKISRSIDKTFRSDSSKISSPKSELKPSDSSEVYSPKSKLNRSDSSKTSSPKCKLNPSDSSKTASSGFRKWLRYHFCFCKGVFFASGLVFSNKLIEYLILSLLITFLVEESSNEQEFIISAIITTIPEAVSALLEIVMISFISNMLFGRFLVITICSLFQIIGLVLLYFSSVGDGLIFGYKIGGILLLAVGKAGVQPLIQKFIADQLKNHELDQANPDEKRIIARKNVWCLAVGSFSALAAFLTYYYSELGAQAFMVSTVATGSSLILFLCGATRFYHSAEFADTRKRLTTIVHHLEAFTKRCIRKQDRDRDWTTSPRPVKIETTTKKTVKYFRGMFFMWTTFLLFGLVLSAAKIFFPYQGGLMPNSQYLASLVVIQSISRKIISYLFELLLPKCVSKANQRKAKLVRIWLGMLLSVACFLVAWLAEFVNVKSIFWLVPQFCLLGFVEGAAQDGLDEFMIDLFPESRNKKEYVSAINTFVIGLGNVGTTIVFTLYSEFTLVDEKVVLQKGFIASAIVSTFNLGLYSIISTLFYYRSKNATAGSESKVPEVKEHESLRKSLLGFISDCIPNP